MKQVPYLQPWTPVTETYCRYEIEEVDGGVRTNIDPVHILEESANIKKVAGKCAPYYPRIQCKTLILRAPIGLLSQDDLLLPEDVVKKMTDEIPEVGRFDVEGTNHYGILMKQHDARDKVIREFLKD